MREHRYSLGLLELAAGVCMLILALYVTLIEMPGVSPFWRFTLSIVGIPLTFWIANKVQEGLPKNAKLATYVYSRPNTLIAIGIFLFLPYLQFVLVPNAQSGRPTFAAALVSGGIILIGGMGPRVAYLVGSTLLLGLGLALYGRLPIAPPFFVSLRASPSSQRAS